MLISLTCAWHTEKSGFAGKLKRSSSGSNARKGTTSTTAEAASSQGLRSKHSVRRSASASGGMGGRSKPEDVYNHPSSPSLGASWMQGSGMHSSSHGDAEEAVRRGWGDKFGVLT